LIGALAELEGLVDDRTGTDLGHAYFDYPDLMTSILTSIEAAGLPDAVELVRLVRAGTSDNIGRIGIDLVAADACFGRLCALLRDELRRVLEIYKSS
jgi:hypothetical protein